VTDLSRLGWPTVQVRWKTRGFCKGVTTTRGSTWNNRKTSIREEEAVKMQIECDHLHGANWKSEFLHKHLKKEQELDVPFNKAQKTVLSLMISSRK
jgi:hypothetical protein